MAANAVTTVVTNTRKVWKAAVAGDVECFGFVFGIAQLPDGLGS